MQTVSFLFYFSKTLTFGQEESFWQIVNFLFENNRRDRENTHVRVSVNDKVYSCDKHKNKKDSVFVYLSIFNWLGQSRQYYHTGCSLTLYLFLVATLKTSLDCSTFHFSSIRLLNFGVSFRCIVRNPCIHPNLDFFLQFGV